MPMFLSIKRQWYYNDIIHTTDNYKIRYEICVSISLMRLMTTQTRVQKS